MQLIHFLQKIQSLQQESHDRMRGFLWNKPRILLTKDLKMSKCHLCGDPSMWPAGVDG